jgi:hypothetical protein
MTPVAFSVELTRLSLENLYKLLEIAGPEQANPIREELAQRYALARKPKSV